MKSKRLYCLIMVIVFLIAHSAAATAQPGQGTSAQPLLETTAESAILIDAASGKVLFEKDPDKALPPASVTKVATLLVAFDAVEKGRVKLTDKVVTSENASSLGGSQIYLEPGEEMPLETMLISIAVGSANDACVAVAEHIAGSHEAYVQMMNDKAKELGCQNTTFVNAYGLPAEGHKTSARDLSIMMREAIKHPLFTKLTSIKQYDLRGGDFVLYNTNKLLWWYRGIEGGKTGWTSEAKYCLASVAKRENLRLIAVVMATPETRSHFRESMKLYNFGFAQFEAVPIAKAGQVMGKVRVAKGNLDWVDAVAAQDIAAVVKKGEKGSVTSKAFVPQVITAPLEKGAPLGHVNVWENGQEALKVDLITAAQVPKGTVFRQMFKLMNNVYSYNS